ncbi:MAG: triphosphoribosyl-dephospho-CoA synthase [Acidilobaceae archaeon]
MRGSSSCSLVSYLSAGLFLEPLLHPKPGAVTLFERHSDKSIWDFAIHASIAQEALLESCRSSATHENPVAAGLRAYKRALLALKISKNVALGSLLLLAPLAAALYYLDDGETLESLCSKARSLVFERDSADAAREYYAVLELLRPSHLGVYEGPLPGVGSGRYPESFVEVLRVARWDIVHREILEGYPLVSRTARALAERKFEQETLLETLLDLLVSEGDTLIATKYGWRAYKVALEEARVAHWLSKRLGVFRALEWLDSLWRPRGWNPGAVLDVLATAIGLALLSLTRRL